MMLFSPPPVQVSETVQGSSWLFVVLFVIVCQSLSYLSGYLGGAFKPSPWIDETAKPRLWPPWWVFPLAWIVNYSFMGCAVWLVWELREAASVSLPLILFGVNLVHNLTFMFFVYKVKTRPFYVFMDTVGLMLVGVITLLFFSVSVSAGLLMLPYLGWMCYTTFIKYLWWRMESVQSLA